MKANITDIVRNKLCLGCGTCEGVCPSDAIRMIYSSKNRTYIPIVQKKECIDCGLCYQVCPGVHMFLPKFDNFKPCKEKQTRHQIGEHIKCFVGHASDNKIRYKSSSGGIATALSVYLLETDKAGAVVATKMKEEKPFETEPVLCTSKKDLINSMGSKYCPAATNSILKQIDTKLIKSIVFTGLPCHIHGINNARKIKPLKELKEIFTIGIFCGGMRGQEGSDWILKKNNISKNDIQSINAHRGNGWPGSMIINLKNQKKNVAIPYPSEIVDEFFESWQPWRCFMCLDRSSELADISLGDAWLPEFKDDSTGTSVIIVRTLKGLNVIENAIRDNIITAFEVDVNVAIKSQTGLWADVERIVEPVLFLRQFFRKRVPEYGIDVKKANLHNLIKQFKMIIRMSFLRKITKSNYLQKIWNLLHVERLF